MYPMDTGQLLYGRKSWVITGAILKVLEGFHNKAARWIVGMTAQRMTSGEWEWSPVADVLDTAGLWPMNECIPWIQDTIVEQLACFTMYDMCMGEERIPVVSRFMGWWDQDVGQEVE